ncbi:MAG: 2-oxoacid:acceptor oxidoreductase family protein [Balneolaceae bacterium]|nr:2-oxoacid:acceptor oxidoreductase family protein [Balneolaceae bacterium]
MMKEIRWHGRGGQGAKTVSELLALALLKSGYFVQAFPEYGPERSGAPIRAYTRSSDQPIRLHCGVTNPDIVIVLDASLLNDTDITEGLESNGLVLVNTPLDAEAIKSSLERLTNLYCLDADRLAEETGCSFSNVVMVGAVSSINGAPALEMLYEAAEEKLGAKLSPEQLQINKDAIEAGYNALKDMEEMV